MKLMNVTVPAGQSIEYAVPPSTFFYLHALGTAGSISVKLFGRSGDLIANLPLVLKGVRYRTSDAAEPFRSVTIKNVTQASATCAFYVGLDEIIPPVTVTGGGGGGGAITGTVSIDSARGLNMYSGEIILAPTGTSLRTLIPAGAVMSDWAVRCATGEMKVGSAVSSGGITLEAGKGLAGSNDYQLTLWTTSSAKAELMVTYR